MYATVAKKKVYYCVACEANYGDCKHTADKSTLPKDERGITLSLAEFDVLVASGDI